MKTILQFKTFVSKQTVPQKLKLHHRKLRPSLFYSTILCFFMLASLNISAQDLITSPNPQYIAGLNVMGNETQQNSSTQQNGITISNEQQNRSRSIELDPPISGFSSRNEIIKLNTTSERLNSVEAGTNLGVCDISQPTFGNPYVSGHSNTGQSFTATCDGSINVIEIYYLVSPGLGGNFNDRTLTIRDGGSPTSPVLHTQIIPYSSIIVGWNTFVLTTPVSINNGEVNSWEISDLGNTADSARGVAYNYPSLYLGGISWYSGSILGDYDATFNVLFSEACAPEITCPPAITVNTDLGSCGAVVTFEEPTATDNCGFSGSGNALNFDGVNDYARTDYANYDFSNFTVEAWINLPTYSNNIHYISLYKNAYIVLGDYGSGSISTWADGLSPISINSSLIPTVDTWHHIAFTYDGAFQRLYIDGVLDQEVATTGSVTLNPTVFNQGLNIGSRYTSLNQYVNGSMDEVRLWTLARSQTEIQASMNSSLASAPGLVTSYSFDEGLACGNNVGSTNLNDGTTNNQDATLFNFDLTGTSGDPCESNWTSGIASGSGSVSVDQTDTTGLTSGHSFPVGTTTLEYTATDGSGNTATCSFDVTVADNEAPIASCKNITVELDANSMVSITAGDIDDGSSDNCGIASITASQTEFGCDDLGPNTVTLTVTDTAELVSTCDATVTVVDNRPQGNYDGDALGDICDEDDDNDGCLDIDDPHPFSIQSATIVISGCNTGVANQALGCSTMADILMDACLYSGSRNAYIVSVYRTLQGWLRAGIINRAQQTAIYSCAVRNYFNCGSYNGNGTYRASDVSLDEPAVDFGVKTWPNPTSNDFNIKVSTYNQLDKIDIQVMDITGKQVHSNTFDSALSYRFGESLQAGVYFVRISQGEFNKTLRVIKQ